MTKSHRRTQGEIGRLTKEDERFDPELRAFLGRAFNLKVLADYDTDPAARPSAENARWAIHTAARFVACVTGAIAPTRQPGGV